MLRVFSPHATAYAVRCKPEQLRDWRRHGFLNGLGERDGKCHLFSASEAARLAIAAFLFRSGFSLRAAFAVVNERENQINALTVQATTDVPAGGDYYLTFCINPDLWSEPFASVTSAPLSMISPPPNAPGALQINVSEIVRATVQRILAYTEHGSHPVPESAAAVAAR